MSENGSLGGSMGGSPVIVKERDVVRIMPPSKVASAGGTPRGKNRADASKQKAERQGQALAKKDAGQLDAQFAWIMGRVKGVSRKSDSEQRLWEAVEKLSDLNQVQKAQITQLTQSQGRFRHKTQSRESMRLEEDMMQLKRREAAELTKRKQEFERLLESHSQTMATVRAQLSEEQAAHKETADLLQDEQIQSKHATDTYKEVQQWLDEAQRKIKTLESEVREHELARQSIDDNTSDMGTKIQHLEADLNLRKEVIVSEQQRASRIQHELGAVEGVIQVEKDESKRLRNQIAANEAEANAEASRLRSEITHLRTDIEVLLERTKRWEDFDRLCPDYVELSAQLESKDEVLHRAKQALTIKHADEQTLVAKAQAREAAVRKRIGELTTVSNTLDNIVAIDDAAPVGKVCVARTLVCCYPDPCPVGRDLHLIVTTCDSTGHPIRGVHKEEFQVQQMLMPPLGGVQLGNDLFIEDCMDNGRASSTFTCSYPTVVEGRSGFRVQFRGHTFMTSANVPAPSPAMIDALETESTRKPRFTVHCSPNTVAVGEEMQVSVVAREEDSFLPSKSGGVLDSEQYRVTSYCTGQGLTLPNPLKQVPGAPVFQLTVPIDDINAQGTPRDYVGIEVMLEGGADAARGSAKLVIDSRNDTEWDPTRTTVSCFPDPANVGDEVSVVVTGRNTYYAPLSQSTSVVPMPIFTASGSSTRIDQPQLTDGPSQCFIGKFFPAETGRCGVQVTMGGIEVGTASVTVQTPDKVDPAQTILTIEPSIVPAGETIHVQVITCDSKGRFTPGPEPTAIRLSPLAASAVLKPLRRVEGMESHYVATIETDKDSSYATAGVMLDFDGVTFSKKVRLTAEPLDAPCDVKPKEAKKPSPQKYSVTFGCDPVQPNSVIPVTIAINQDEKVDFDRRQPAPKVPVIRPVVNAELAGDVTPLAGARCVWTCLVRVGSANGTASIAAVVDSHTYGASTTVQANNGEDFDTEIDRLKNLEIRIRDLTRRTEERERDCDERDRQLDAREAELRMREEEANEANQVTEEQENQQHLLFGLQLSDGVMYGTQWDSIDGAKVVDLLPDGPLDRVEPKVTPGDILKEVQYEDSFGYIHTCAVRQMDDFRRICRMLSRQGLVPLVTLTFLNQNHKLYRLDVRPATTPDPPGRSLGTRRHPSKSIDTSMCSTPIAAISPARSR